MKTALSRFDARVTRTVRAWPGSVRPIMVAASFVGVPIFTLGLCGAVTLVGFTQQRHALLAAGGIALIVILIGDVMKLTIRRTRPLTDPARGRRYRTFSFPSGHALGVMVTFGLLALVSAAGPWIWLADVVIIFAVGVSRVYLGAHYPSVVIAGWLIGALGLVAIALVGGAGGF